MLFRNFLDRLVGACLLGAALLPSAWAKGPSTLAALPPLKAAISCAAVAQVDLSDAVGAPTRILSAASKSLDGHAVCEIRAEIAPHIGVLARLPEQGWSQRYLQTGCGGLCGVLDIRADHAQGCTQYDDGSLALASTDMGHTSKSMGDGEFSRDPQARIDFAYRSVHLTAVAMQALISKFYGAPARYRYFSGCSDGGREALMEAQRYPEDFDGIAAGAPAMNFQVQNSFYHAWQSRSNTGADGKGILTSDKLPLLHAAVLKDCDSLDGSIDGVIEDPRACKFDPAVLRCKARDDPRQCLSDAQVEATRKLYAGPSDAHGHRFTAGGPQYGSELSWRGVFVSDTPQAPIPSTFMALGAIKGLIFEDRPPESYGIQDFQFDQATFDRVKPLRALNDATNPDIGAFVDKGGKLMLWHGWSDPHISPLNTIAYLSAVKRTLGEAKAAEAVRLFMIPGLYHCGGGEGPVEFDLLTPLMQWVEANQAPEALQTHLPSGPPPWLKREGGGPPSVGHDGPPPGMLPLDLAGMKPSPGAVTQSVVFAYPALARYSGRGARADVSSYEKAAPMVTGRDEPAWEGASFMTPGFQRPCKVENNQVVCAVR